MPQFEITSYLSQAFWMLISFGCLFFMVSLVIFPALNDIFAKRRRRIDDTLAKAARLNEQAEKLMHDYDAFMADATRIKNEQVRAAYADITRAGTAAEAEHDRQLRGLIQEAETKIEASKNRLEAESDKIAAVVANRLADKFFHAKGNQV